MGAPVPKASDKGRGARCQEVGVADVALCFARALGYLTPRASAAALHARIKRRRLQALLGHASHAKELL